MNMIPPPKPRKLENLNALQLKLADLVDWIDYYRAACNLFAKEQDAPCDPYVPDVKRIYSDSSFSRIPDMPLFDLVVLWLSCCRLYEYYQDSPYTTDAWFPGKTPDPATFDALPPREKMFITMLVRKASKILETAMQSPERREQQQVDAGLDLDKYSAANWLDYLFEELLPARFLAD